MSGDYGASHWGSDKVWDRRIKRRSQEKNPYSITIKVGEKDMDRLDAIKAYYTEDTKGISWENMSMLIRQIITYEYLRIEDMRAEKEKQKKGQV